MMRAQSKSALGNYLRARGEYPLLPDLANLIKELPPRTRRILLRFSPLAAVRGTTSAHAENTTNFPHKINRQRNYLRARGEYTL